MVDSFFKEDDSRIGQSEIPSLDDSTEERTGKADFDRDRGVIAAVLSYIPLLCLVPLLQMRDNEQARFHSKQGLILFLIELLALLFLIPGLSSLVWKMVIILALGASVAGIIFGLQGKRYKLPLIGDIAEKMRI
ncbi:MAG: hypothetical protein JSV44_10480 [Candidatus Zixiibacteriota bacterium]|nr:MAG: hypothetical protein JSV44_10480 [candidate division Zixibacteria bacterium]